MTNIITNTICYDKIIIGAGIYGLYAARYCGRKGEKVLVIEKEKEPFTRATYINQARVHMGYHYPRSYSTAIKSANYFERFVEDFPKCIYSEFKQIYATSNEFSWTNANQFKKFCKQVNIFCEDVEVDNYFKKSSCDGAFLTKEYTYDAMILKDILSDDLKSIENVDIIYNSQIKSIENKDEYYYINCNTGFYKTKFLLNATYASVNQILDLLGYEKFKIKYELCEIILCKVDSALKNIGLTVMDGPFFSIMPFGKTGLHSLTSVTFTPHDVSYDELPTFECQKNNDYCSKFHLGNCNFCKNKPKTAWIYMSNLAKKYMNDKFEFEYVSSLYSMKPILMASEIDDSRPTVIKKYTSNPYFYTVLSGKINTVYDLEEIL